MTALNLLVFMSGILLRTFVARYPHSGQGKPPMFGDYEAQRHWQEITINTPINEWYFNTTLNNLNYWGLDYPPLTAYHSWLVGKAAEALNSSYVELHTSRGLEDPSHRLFMRGTVLLADVLIFAPAVFAFSWSIFGGDEKKSSACSVLLLAYPGLILIDHGHFQYNGVSLGLMILSFAAILRDKDCLGSMLFVLALNYKQMELYHALPFFFYLLGKCFQQPTWSTSIFKLFCIGSTVIGTFVVVWFPFLTSTDQFMQVMHRVFPLARGVFEDKVANVWCAVNVVVKIKELYSVDQLAVACLGATLLASIPSSIVVFLQPTKVQFSLALINTSLAFFLFSFQVHEKSILLVAIPVLLYLGGFREYHGRYTPIVSIWFLTMATGSMFPLLQRDLLVIPTLALSAFFLILSHFLELFEPRIQMIGQKSSRHNSTPQPIDKSQVSTWSDWIVWTLFNFSLMGLFVFAVSSAQVEPPKKYPHFWQLLISLFSLLHFILFGVYFQSLQFSVYRKIRQETKVVSAEKKKQ